MSFELVVGRRLWLVLQLALLLTKLACFAAGSVMLALLCRTFIEYTTTTIVLPFARMSIRYIKIQLRERVPHADEWIADPDAPPPEPAAEEEPTQPAEQDAAEDEGGDKAPEPGNPIATVYCWLAVFACAITVYPPSSLFLLTVSGLSIFYEYITHAEEMTTDSTVHTYVYGACLMICLGVLFAPYVTLLQLGILMLCVLTVEEYQKKLADDQPPAFSQKKTWLGVMFMIGTCTLISSYALVFLVVMLLFFAGIDKYYCENSYGAVFWLGYLVFCICIVLFQPVALCIVAVLGIRAAGKIVAVDHYMHEHLDAVKGAVQRNMRAPNISVRDVLAFTKKQLVENFSNEPIECAVCDEAEPEKAEAEPANQNEESQTDEGIVVEQAEAE